MFFLPEHLKSFNLPRQVLVYTIQSLTQLYLFTHCLQNLTATTTSDYHISHHHQHHTPSWSGVTDQL